MRLYVQPSPSGGAAKLIMGLSPGRIPLVFATPTPDPPDPANPGPNARLVVGPSSRLTPASNPFVALEHPPLQYFVALDIHPSLESAPVTYHLYSTGGASVEGPVSVTVDAVHPLRQALVYAIRDTVRPRLEYHLARIVQAGIVRPAAGYIPILEQESLAKDDPIPCVLVKELLSPADYAIGLDRGEWKDMGNGQAYREQAYRYRARIDLLLLSETPGERTLLANELHGAILIDAPLFEEAGYRSFTVQRMTRSGVMPDGWMMFGEEITLEGEVEFAVRERMYYSVSPGLTPFFTPLR